MVEKHMIGRYCNHGRTKPILYAPIGCWRPVAPLVKPKPLLFTLCNAVSCLGIQMKRGITARDEGSRSVLAMAVASKNKGMVEAVLAALEERLTDDEV